MRFTVNIKSFRDDIQAAIVCATFGVQKDHKDIYKLTISNSKAGVTVIANSGFISMEKLISNKELIDLDYVYEEAGTVTVNATNLNDVLKAFDETDVVQIYSENGADEQPSQLFVRRKVDEKASERDKELKDEWHSLPVSNEQIVIPEVAKTFEKQFQINVSEFTKATDITDAIGWAPYKPAFLYWITRVRTDGFRAVCGDGSRFMVYEKEGKDVVKADGKMDICIYKDHTEPLNKILKLLPSATMMVAEHVKGKEKDKTDKFVDQIVFVVGGTTLLLSGYEPDIKWPDENKFLDRKNVYKMTTHIKDWKKASAGINITLEPKADPNKKQIKMTVDMEKRILSVKSEAGLMKTVRKLSILNVDNSSEVSVLNFNCNMDYMKNLADHGDPSEQIQLEFVDESAPVICRYHADNAVQNSEDIWQKNSDETRERKTIFFASFNPEV